MSLRRDRAQEISDFAAQLGGGVFDFLGSHQHGLRRTARLGDAAGHFAQRGDDRFGAVGGAGDIM
jgi:hypothetical protein